MSQKGQQVTGVVPFNQLVKQLRREDNQPKVVVSTPKGAGAGTTSTTGKKKMHDVAGIR